MSAMKTIILLCVAVLSIAPAVLAQEDAEGCKDSPMITRMAGSKISSCDHKEFDSATFSMPPDAEGNAKEKTVEGEVSTWDYVTREGVSELQVIRNVESALKRAGFTIDYENSPGQLTAHKGNVWFGFDNRGSYYDQTIVVEKAGKIIPHVVENHFRSTHVGGNMRLTAPCPSSPPPTPAPGPASSPLLQYAPAARSAATPR